MLLSQSHKELRNHLQEALYIRVSFTPLFEGARPLARAILKSYVLYHLPSKISRHEPRISPRRLSLGTHFCYRYFDIVGNTGMKLGKVNAAAVLAEIGELLDEFNDLHCVVSTLDLLFFNHVATTSGRITGWVQLTSPNMSSCLHLLDLPHTDALSPIAQCIMECNGHLRTLGRLLVIWRGNGVDRTQPVRELMSQLVSAVPSWQPIPQKVFIDALLGRYVTRLHVYGQGATVADLIA